MRARFYKLHSALSAVISVGVAFSIATVISCGGSGDGAPTSPTDPNQPAGQTAIRIQISPRTDTTTGSVAEGDTLHLTVVALDSAGAVVALPAPATWASIDSTARVGTTGTMTLLGSGASRIAAYSGKLADTVSFNLQVAPKLQVRISPRTDTTQNHAVGDTVQLSASVKDVFLNKDLSGTTPVTWTALDTAGTVSSSGKLIVRNSGTERVVAAAGTVADTVTLVLKVTLPSLRLVSINGVTLSPAGPNAVADSFNVAIEVRNPPDGYVVGTVFFVANTPIGTSTGNPPAASNIQPGETRTVAIRDLFTPPGNYDAYPRVLAGSLDVSGSHIPLTVSNSDVTPPQLQSLSPSQDTTWQSGTALKITLNVVDLESGVEGFVVQATWASPQQAGCMDHPSGVVDPNVNFTGIPVTLNFTGCVVPLGVNTVVITGIDRAGNTTSRTLKITGT
jgi:hypothetical protein